MSILKSMLLNTSSMLHGAADVTAENIAALTEADLKEYRGYFKLVHERDTTLTHEELASLVLSTDDDMEPKDWAEVMLNAEVEEEGMIGLPTPSDTTAGSAYSYAVRMSKELLNDIDVLGEGALEAKRGRAVIMFDLFRDYGKEVVEGVGTEKESGWPRPGSFKPGSGKITDDHAGDNERWDKEETTITKVDGTSGKGTKSFYQELVDFSPRGHALLEEKAAVKKLIGDARKTKKKAGAIDIKRNNFKSNIIGAVKLAQRMAFVNAKTGMNCEVEMDDGQVAASNKLIFIQDKTAHTKFDVITIGQFLALKVSEGATYSAIVGTTVRKPKSGTGPQAVEVNINSTIDFDKVTAAYSVFIDKINVAIAGKDMKPYNGLLTHLNSAGTDELLLSMNSIMDFFEGILSKKAFADRLAVLLNDGKAPKETKVA